MALQQIAEVEVDGVVRPIHIDVDEGRIEIASDGPAPVMVVHLLGSRLSLIHTEVPPALRGRGLADALAKAALGYARTHSLAVNPICPFVRQYLTKHPEFQELVKNSDA